MKNLQNNFTTLKQSKRLLKLGVPTDSADMKWRRIKRNSHGDKPLVKCEWNVALKHETELVCGFMEYEYIPCWSVGRLNEIFKICSDVHIEIYDLDLEGTQIERAMQAFEEYAEYNWLDFSKLED